MYLADQPFWLIRQFVKKNTALLLSIQIKIDCLVTSRVVSQEGYAQSVSFSNTVSLSQPHHTECLIAIQCIEEPTPTDFLVPFSVQQRHSSFLYHYFNFFVRYKVDLKVEYHSLGQIWLNNIIDNL